VSSLKKIITGGQTGVDRGAMEAALAAGFPCGGNCPEGRLAEDGIIPERYPVKELTGGGYAARSEANVAEADGVVVFAPGSPTGGTALTIEFARRHEKPVRVIDAAVVDPEEAVERVITFLEEHAVGVLDVAGPRLTGWPGGEAYSRAVIERVLARARP
jgi:predicted Rossmann-fold nucleotide-binding protein